MKTKDIILLIFLVSVFMILSVYKIELPGFYEDEAFRVVPSLEILKNDILLHNLYSFKLFGRSFPIMLTPFSGAFDSYTLLPIVYLFGISVKVIRISQVFFAAIGIILAFFLIKRIFNKTIAFITALLLCINPSFILFNRQGILASSISMPITMLALLMIYRWHITLKKQYLYAGFFLLGIPLFNNANFFWLIAASAVSCWIVFKNDIRNLFTSKKLDNNTLLIAFYCLLLGSAPFVWYNIQNWGTLSAFFKGFAEYAKIEGFLWYLKALRKNILVFIFILSGGWSAGSYGYSKGIINHIYPVLFLSSIIFTPFLIERKEKLYLKKVLFLISTIIFIFLQAPFSLKDVSAYNLFILYPLIQIVIAIFLFELFNFLVKIKSRFLLIILFFALLGVLEFFTLKGCLSPIFICAFILLNVYFFIRKKEASYFLSIFLILLIFFELATIFGYYRAVNKTGGAGYFSDSFYDLADFLKRNKELKPVAMDWGFRNRLWILTKGEVKARAFYSKKIKDNRHFDVISKKLLNDPDNVYLTYIPYLDISGNWEQFKKIAEDSNVKLKEIRRSYQKDGKPVIVMYGNAYLVGSNFYFIDSYNNARVKLGISGEAGIKEFVLNGIKKKVIFQHPVSEIAYTLKLPIDPVLSFSAGISENCWDRTDGASGRIYVIYNGERYEVFFKYLNPHSNQKDRGWLDYKISLSQFSRKKVTLIFRTYPGPEVKKEGDYTADWWGWGEPAIISLK